MTTPDLQAQTEAYLQAIADHDLARSLDFYADDATIHFAMGVYSGREALAQWHADRFEANFEIVRLDRIRVRDNQVTIQAIVTSNRLKSWFVPTLRGKGVFEFEGQKIREVSFAITGYNPFEA